MLEYLSHLRVLACTFTRNFWEDLKNVFVSFKSHRALSILTLLCASISVLYMYIYIYIYNI